MFYGIKKGNFVDRGRKRKRRGMKLRLFLYFLCKPRVLNETFAVKRKKFRALYLPLVFSIL